METLILVVCLFSITNTLAVLKHSMTIGRFKGLWIFLAVIIANQAHSQNLLEEKVVMEELASDENVFFSAQGKLFLTTIRDSNVSLRFSNQDTTLALNGYSEFHVDTSSRILGVLKDSILFETEIRFGVGIKVNGFELFGKEGGQSRSWQTSLPQNGWYENGLWYTRKAEGNQVRIQCYNIINETSKGEVLYGGEDSLITAMFNMEKWMGLFMKKSTGKLVSKYQDPEAGWIEFPYPINSAEKDLLAFNLNSNDRIFVTYASRQNQTRRLIQYTIQELNVTNEVVDSMKVGDYSFFYQIDSLNAVAVPGLSQEMSADGKIQVIPSNPQQVTDVQDTGRFSVIMETFKTSKDAFDFLNKIIKVMPGSKAVKRKNSVDVVGPQRVSLNSVKADSAYLFANKIQSRIQSKNDFTPIPSLYVTIFVKDMKDGGTLPCRVSIFSRNEDEILYSSNVKDGKVHFVFPKDGTEVGVLISAQGYIPRSLRVFIDDFKKTQKFTQVISLEKVPEEKKFEFNLNNVLFDFDSDRLTNVAVVEMEALRDLLSDYLVDSLSITGHCDSVGTDVYNDALGLRRANSVKKFVAELELGGYVEIGSKGKRDPVMSNTTEFGRSLNRRVQFKIRLRNKDNEKIEIVESQRLANDDEG